MSDETEAHEYRLGSPLASIIGLADATLEREDLQLETRVMRSPRLEVELQLPAPLALGRSVGDDHLDRLIVDVVGNTAPAVEEVP